MRVERDQLRILLAVVAVATLFVAGLWLPQRYRQHRLEAAIAAAEQEQQAHATCALNLQTLARREARLRHDTAASERYVPPEGELADLLRQISSELQREKVTDQEIQTQPLAIGANYCVMPITLRFRCSFPAAYGFLRSVESLHRLVRVTRVELAGEADQPGRPLQARLELCGLFLPAGEKRQ
jgi:Tfp pilus assembly protein PilO